MKVLFITNHYLDESGGGSFASRAFANAFAVLAEECVILYPDRGKSIEKYIHPKYKLIGVPNTKGQIHKLLDIYIGKIHRFKKIAMKQISIFLPDIVVFDNSRCSAGLIELVKQKRITTITIHHNYEMEYYRGTPPNIFMRIPFIYYMQRTEKASVLLSDLNLTLTCEDAELLKHNYAEGVDISITSLGCFEYSSNCLQMPTSRIRNLNLKFVITGSLNETQTEISLIPFLEDIYPNLLETYPDSELIIAGKNPTNNIKTICSKFPSIKLIANPEDMQEIISNSDIYICPTSVGGGIKLRIMDGLKGGLPVITHKVSARGYEVFHENGCMFIYNNKSTFANELNRLVELRQNNKLSSEWIQDTYNANFSFKSGTDRLKYILNTNFKNNIFV
jgi:hypothetical protein